MLTFYADSLRVDGSDFTALCAKYDAHRRGHTSSTAQHCDYCLMYLGELMVPRISYLHGGSGLIASSNPRDLGAVL